jgi:hypothetical protein
MLDLFELTGSVPFGIRLPKVPYKIHEEAVVEAQVFERTL